MPAILPETRIHYYVAGDESIAFLSHPEPVASLQSTINKPPDVSSSHTVDALVTALMNLNMSSVTANALVTVIQAIANGDQTPAVHQHPGQTDHAADLDVEDDADEGAQPTPAFTTTPAPSSTATPAPSSTTTPAPSSTTLAPAVGSMAAAIVKPSLSTNADSVGLPPKSVSYQGFPYEIPHLSAEGPFYCVIKGKCVGVLST
ncbi:hypothetical protein EV702DRAFT_1043406 [Suillus placidus]|uniref:Uncharacterized protein n=1 Tax=Suillus placidus TaxID=48579 RepID=A0A9P7A110_9AGAM|nr:hypothetical protein EV702DRAFT_1043406 [Suillus placidus]